MTITIREMRNLDARAFLEVHRAAVHALAAKDYPDSVIQAWAPLPITENNIAAVIANPDNETRFVAEIDGKVAGIGVLVIQNNELRACYVGPEAVRNGVGSALVRKIEAVALDRGLSSLQLDSSLTAAPFYAALGYITRGRGVHILRSGQKMACVKMDKQLQR
jgi:putative acetyltransferase